MAEELIWCIPHKFFRPTSTAEVLQARVETGPRQTIGEVEALSSLSEQVFRKLDNTENILGDWRNTINKIEELCRRFESEKVGRQIMTGETTAGKDAKRAVEALSGDDYGINLATVKQIRTQVRQKRDVYWTPNKFGEQKNAKLGVLLDQVYDGLTEDYFGGAEQAADKVSCTNPELRGALSGVREINRTYADNNEPETIFHDVC